MNNHDRNSHNPFSDSNPGDERPYDEDGLCPICQSEGEHLNVRHHHYQVCHEHQVFWHIGEFIFPAWEYNGNENDVLKWQKNYALLTNYTAVVPVFLPEEPCDPVPLMGIDEHLMPDGSVIGEAGQSL